MILQIFGLNTLSRLYLISMLHLGCIQYLLFIFGNNINMISIVYFGVRYVGVYINVSHFGTNYTYLHELY